MFGKTVLESLGLQFGEMLYSTATVSVYTGTFNSFPAVYKVLQLPSSVNYQDLEKECAHQVTIQNEHIVRLYNYQWAQTLEGVFLVMVLERCDKDLFKDMKDRKINNFPYSEQGLWKVMFDLIQTLATMQEQGLAHRDIKPENIFLSQQTVKIGDFGSSRFSIQDQMYATVVGTPLYLSPYLRKAFSSSSVKTAHNVFKSDVYSLGLTFLAMGMLEPPVFVLKATEAQIQAAVYRLRYAKEINSIIAWMLLTDEQARPDFVQLYTYIMQTFYPVQQSISTVVTSPRYGQEAEALIADEATQWVAPVAQRAAPVAQQPAARTAPAQRPSPQPTSYQSIPQPRSQAPVHISENAALKVAPARQTEFQVAPAHLQDVKGSTAVKIEDQVQISVQKRVEEGKAEDIDCLGCRKRIDITAEGVVQLKCQPDAHMYCSLTCFNQSIAAQERQRARLSCPTCRSPIEPDDIAFYACPPPPSTPASIVWMTACLLWMLIVGACCYLVCCCKRRNQEADKSSKEA